MRTFAALLAFAVSASAAGGFTFTLAPPSDPLEPVTSGATQVNSAEERAAAVALLLRAGDQSAMHAKGTPAHILQMSFNASASTLFPGGAGQLRETWISGQNWRWDASLGSYSLLRISSNGVAYDQQTPQPLPLRLKMLANAVFAPLQFARPRVSPMRTASVMWKGAQVTCVLLGGADRAEQDSAAAGRRWSEGEFCVDPATGFLDVYSEVPGIYVFYDYTNALKFHDRTLPSAVTIYENGVAVVQAQLTGITDTNPADTSPFTPTAQMREQGPAVVLFAPILMTRRVPVPGTQDAALVEPVEVHVTLDEQGKVQESELLQSSGLSAQALDFVRQMEIWPAPQAGGTPPRQREAFVRVEYIPAPRASGPAN